MPVVIEGLRRLEYRGYDSAGVAWELRGEIHVARSSGKLQALENKLAAMPAITSTCAMGHTRWATHGAPEERNAHPHYSNNATLAIVHNGIIENFQEIKNALTARNYQFHSDTDTEVLVNLIQEKTKTAPDLLHAFAEALSEAHGAYAICMLSSQEPGVLYGARMSAPLIFGKGTSESFIASDIPAFLPWTREVVFLEDNEIIRATPTHWEIFDLRTMKRVDRPVQSIKWDMQAAQKDGYRHFMLKEIFEQPRVIRDGLAGRIFDNEVILAELENLPVPKRVHIVACGTSYHSGLWARYLLEPWAHIGCNVEIASEYRYRDLILDRDDLVILISQSGETADTLAALRKARSMGAKTVGLCNVVGSTLAREADVAIFTQAGPEISVASTKAMASQMLALCLLAVYWGRKKGVLDIHTAKDILQQLENLPRLLDDNLPEMRKRARELAPKYAQASNFFFLGRGEAWPLALEGALKLKELSYIHAEGYAAGELKHGPIALIDPSFPSFVLALNDPLFAKIKSNVEEIEARLGPVIALVNASDSLKATDEWVIPELQGPLAGFMVLPALQLFSYEVADFLGKDVDQPRNLAKSVTVE